MIHRDENSRSPATNHKRFRLFSSETLERLAANEQLSVGLRRDIYKELERRDEAYKTLDTLCGES